jgi:hypothetical protein
VPTAKTKATTNAVQNATFLFMGTPWWRDFAKSYIRGSKCATENPARAEAKPQQLDY